MSEVGYVLKTTLILENVVFCIPWKFLQTYLTAESGYCWNRLLAGHWKLWTPYSFPLFVFASKPVTPVTSTWKFEPHSSRSLHNSSAQALVVHKCLSGIDHPAVPWWCCFLQSAFNYCLVVFVWLPFFYFPISWVAVIIPSDEIIFFRGVAQPPTRLVVGISGPWNGGTMWL